MICGVGRGLGRREYNGLGIDQNEARGRFDEGLQLLKQLLATGRADFDGEHFQVKGVRLRPQPTKDLSENLWCAGGTEQTVEIIAKNDVKPLTIPTTSLELALQNAQMYARLRQRGRPRHAGAHQARAVDLRARERRTRPVAAPSSSSPSTPTPPSGTTSCSARTFRTSRATRPTAPCRRRSAPTTSLFRGGFVDSHPWGTPDQAIKRATELAEAFGTDEIMFVFKYGSMPIEAAEKSMRLFAREVMPALKELNPRPIEVGDDDGPLVTPPR